jgi:hypothetical protein
MPKGRWSNPGRFVHVSSPVDKKRGHKGPFSSSTGGEGGIVRLRRIPRCRSGPVPLRGTVLRGAPRARWSNPGRFVHVSSPVDKKRGHKGPFSSSTGGEGGIRTHEYLVRYYWNSSPAPSTTRPPLRTVTATCGQSVQRPVLALPRKARIPRWARDRRRGLPARRRRPSRPCGSLVDHSATSPKGPEAYPRPERAATGRISSRQEPGAHCSSGAHRCNARRAASQAP